MPSEVSKSRTQYLHYQAATVITVALLLFTAAIL